MPIVIPMKKAFFRKERTGSQEIRRVYKTVNGEKIGEPLSTTTETVKSSCDRKKLVVGLRRLKAKQRMFRLKKFHLRR